MLALDGFPSWGLPPAAVSSTLGTCSSAGDALAQLLCELSSPSTARPYHVSGCEEGGEGQTAKLCLVSNCTHIMYSTPIDLSFSYLRSAEEASQDKKKEQVDLNRRVPVCRNKQFGGGYWKDFLQ